MTENIFTKAESRYGKSVVFLVIVNSIFGFISSCIVVVLLLQANDAREEILNCTSADRVNSDCQQTQNARTGAAITDITRRGAAYVLCADRLNGDEVIKACVDRLLREESR